MTPRTSEATTACGELEHQLAGLHQSDYKPRPHFRIRQLGRVRYREASALQHGLAVRSRDDYLILLEHPHVFTLGVRADESHILLDPKSAGVELEYSNRGGDVTYHGPGQLVVYPILTLADVPGAGPNYVRELEQVVIETLEDLGIENYAGKAGRMKGYPGVWVGLDESKPRKIAAIGVRTIRPHVGSRRSMHGVAINVNCDLKMFDGIVPCGISEFAVTSLEAEGMLVSIDEVAETFISRAVAMWHKGGDFLERQSVVVSRSSSSSRSSTSSSVRQGAQTSFPVDENESALVTRLRRAGVNPKGGLSISSRKPDWLRVPVRMGKEYLGLGRTIHDLGLVTVCEEAGCPNIYECWSEGTATFMVNGSRCTRACGFCQVDTSHPLPLDPSEPDKVALAVERMRLAHAVITCVARDDLLDGGAGAIASTISAIRARCNSTVVEVLISDCKGDPSSLEAIFGAQPDVVNHNIETVARLQRAVRPSAGYARSLSVLARAVQSGLTAKSGLMVGLGETMSEVASTMADLNAIGVSIVTVGQYLRPSIHHLPVARWWSLDEFDEIRAIGQSLGLAHVEASPLTRSSYHAKNAAKAVGLSKMN